MQTDREGGRQLENDSVGIHAREPRAPSRKPRAVLIVESLRHPCRFHPYRRWRRNASPWHRLSTVIRHDWAATFAQLKPLEVSHASRGEERLTMSTRDEYAFDVTESGDLAPAPRRFLRSAGGAYRFVQEQNRERERERERDWNFNRNWYNWMNLLRATYIENFSSQSFQYFLNFKYILSIFKYNQGETGNKFITSESFLSSDIMPTSLKRKRRTLLYTVWSLVMVRNRLSEASG